MTERNLDHNTINKNEDVLVENKTHDIKKEEEAKDNNQNQQLARWHVLEKKIKDNLELLNRSNIKEVIFSLFKLNLIRARGLFVEYIMKIQRKNVDMTDVYAALVSVINSKIPKIGELLINRLLVSYRTTSEFNHRHICEATLNFLSQLINFRVSGCILAFQIMDDLLSTIDDSRISFIEQMLGVTGKHLFNEDSTAVDKIYDRLRNTLSEGLVKKRGQLLIQKCFQSRKLEFENINEISEELDLVEEDDIISHDVRLNNDHNTHHDLNSFLYDPNYEENEKTYETLKKEILGDDNDDDSGGSSDPESGNNSDEDLSDSETTATAEIKDFTERSLLDFQKKVYLTVMSSMGPEEATHKILKIPSLDSKRKEYLLVDMILKCCAQEKTYSKYYGSIGEILVIINDNWRAAFDEVFKETYENCSKFETTLLRNIGKFWGHMFASDKMGWEVLSIVKLTEEDTSSSGRIFLKFLFQRMLEELGVSSLVQRLNEDYIQEYLKGIFPYENPEHLRFSINFFTAIGLGKLTDRMRESLISMTSSMASIETRGRKRLTGEESPRSDSYSRSRSHSSSYSRSRSSSNRRDSSYSRSPPRKRPAFENVSKEMGSNQPDARNRYRNNINSRGKLPTGPRSHYTDSNFRSENNGYRRGYSGSGRRGNYRGRGRN